VSDTMPSLDEPRTLGMLRRRISTRIKAVLDVDANVTFAEPKSLRQVTGGEGRVTDKRPG